MYIDKEVITQNKERAVGVAFSTNLVTR